MFARFAQKLYPAIQMSTGGILMPPTAPITCGPPCALRHQGRQVADQVAGLVAPRTSSPVTFGTGLALRVRERRDLHRVVGDRELRCLPWIGVRDLRACVRHQEAGADDGVRAAHAGLASGSGCSPRPSSTAAEVRLMPSYVLRPVQPCSCDWLNDLSLKRPTSLTSAPGTAAAATMPCRRRRAPITATSAAISRRERGDRRFCVPSRALLTSKPAALIGRLI